MARGWARPSTAVARRERRWPMGRCPAGGCQVKQRCQMKHRCKVKQRLLVELQGKLRAIGRHVQAQRGGDVEESASGSRRPPPELRERWRGWSRGARPTS